MDILIFFQKVISIEILKKEIERKNDNIIFNSGFSFDKELDVKGVLSANFSYILQEIDLSFIIYCFVETEFAIVFANNKTTQHYYNENTECVRDFIKSFDFVQYIGYNYDSAISIESIVENHKSLNLELIDSITWDDDFYDYLKTKGIKPYWER